tara:strand:- start:2011 stop:3621 length:1611 start_codon:yes stop_codon:yes gene_type:complete
MMMGTDNTIESRWRSEDSKRWEILDRARLCSSLTKPWVLPPKGHDDNQKLPEPFSSLASRGATNLEGKLLLSLFPVGIPFFKLRPSQEFRFNPEVTPEVLQKFEQMLFIHEMAMMATLESSKSTPRSNGKRNGFRSRKRAAISQLLITGDVLEQLTDDYKIKVFRRDQYVTQRDSGGEVQFHIIKERVDPLTLTTEQQAKAGYGEEDLLGHNHTDRMVDLYTLVEWQPVSKTWLIKQEVRNKIIVESEEKITPFFATPYELAPQEHYGRGIVELNLGDVRSMNELTMSILDFAAISSKMLFAKDYNSQVRDEELAQSSGSVINARVQSGQIMDVGVLRVDKMQDFNTVVMTRDSIRKDLATTMLMEGESTPRGERVTAYQVSRVAGELDQALAGAFGAISDSQQVPLVDRLRYQMTRDKLLPPMPDDSVEIEAVTGIAALSQAADGQKMMSAFQTLSQFGPEFMQRVNMDVFIDLIMRYSGVHEPGLIKSPEELQAEQQAAQQQAVEAQAKQKGVEVLGNAAEASMMNEMAPQEGT